MNKSVSFLKLLLSIYSFLSIVIGSYACNELPFLSSQRYDIKAINGTFIALGMSLEDVIRNNPRCNITMGTVYGYDDELESAEGYDYYNLYNEYGNRTCVFVLSDGLVSSITVLDRSFLLNDNVSLGVTCEKMLLSYQDGVWVMGYNEFDYRIKDYFLGWCHYYIPSEGVYFSFRMDQFCESEWNEIYDAVNNDIIYIHGLSSVVYDSFKSKKIYGMTFIKDGNERYQKNPYEFTGVWVDSIGSTKLALRQYEHDLIGEIHSTSHGCEWDNENCVNLVVGSIKNGIGAIIYPSFSSERNNLGYIRRISESEIELRFDQQSENCNTLYKINDNGIGMYSDDEIREKIKALVNGNDYTQVYSGLCGTKWQLVTIDDSSVIESYYIEFLEDNHVRTTINYKQVGADINCNYKYYYDYTDSMWIMYGCSSIDKIAKRGGNEEKELAFKIGDYYLISFYDGRLYLTDFVGETKEFISVK